MCHAHYILMLECVRMLIQIAYSLPVLVCRVLFVQFVSVGWNAYLAWVAFR